MTGDIAKDNTERLNKFIGHVDHLLKELGVKNWILSANIELTNNDGSKFILSEVVRSDLSFRDILEHQIIIHEFMSDSLGQVYGDKFLPSTAKEIEMISQQNVIENQSEDEGTDTVE